MTDPQPAGPPLPTGPLRDPFVTRISRRYKLIITGIFAGAVILLSTLTLAAVISLWNSDDPFGGKRNVILMVSDGLGPAGVTMARNFFDYLEGIDGAQGMLELDTLLVGASRTRSADSLITDSAAGATAFACGIKTYNGAIAVDVQKKPCATVLEAAKDAGYLTGMVVTSRITHATPACFAAHVASRASENAIALQEIGQTPLGLTTDLLFGGGSCQFQPNASATSCRADKIDAFSVARGNGYAVLTPDIRDDFDNLEPSQAKLPLINLFAPDHMDFEIDRNPKVQPSLAEMTQKALDILSHSSKKNDKAGFFLMIEGSRIDMAAHNNDPATHVRETLAYNEAIKAVKSFVDRNPQTVVISVSDHETGGLSIGRQNDPDKYPAYLWKPAVLAGVQRSLEVLALELANWSGGSSKKRDYVENYVIPVILNVTDASAEEVDGVATARSAPLTLSKLSDIVSPRAQIGWTTHGHSAVDVNLYAYGYRSEKLRGNHENTDVGQFLIETLGVQTNIEKLGKKLRNEMTMDEVEIRGDMGKARNPISHYHDST
ncbi:hypothetical protein HDU85_002759 [Gaertneriomyces sp. JEL0708]|nr:hypothetical protein HDU85_002759 [Gaertneriomyces sp. JEL0708]